MGADGTTAGRLTTHVLDVAAGHPAAGVRIELFRIGDGGKRERVAVAVTNSDGRCDAPLMEGADFVTGIYELVFHVGDYFGLDCVGGDPEFLGQVPVRVGLSAAGGHYHVPLLVSPYGYTTYRGS